MQKGTVTSKTKAFKSQWFVIFGDGVCFCATFWSSYFFQRAQGSLACAPAPRNSCTVVVRMVLTIIITRCLVWVFILQTSRYFLALGPAGDDAATLSGCSRRTTLSHTEGCTPASDVAQSLEQLSDIEIDWSDIACFLFQQFVCLRLVSGVLTQSFMRAFSTQKDTVAKLSKKEQEQEQEEKRDQLVCMIQKKTEDFFSKESFVKELVPLHMNQLTSSLFSLTPPSPSFFPSSTIILIMFRQLNMPALTTAQIWGNWLICTIINVGLSP